MGRSSNQNQNPSSVNQQPWQPRRDNIVPEAGDDAYCNRKQPAEPAQCPSCSAVLHNGHWDWMDSVPAGAQKAKCPACLRIEDKYPAGFLTLGGAFFQQHRAEILNLVQNESSAETAEHPLHRLIATEDAGEGVLITTTDIHLPRRLGEAIRHAYHGAFYYHYLEDDTILRASWNR